MSPIVHPLHAEEDVHHSPIPAPLAQGCSCKRKLNTELATLQNSRRLGLLPWVLAGIVAVAPTVFLLATQDKVAALKTSRLDITDKEGRVRIRMEVDDAGAPSLVFLTDTGVPRIMVAVSPDKKAAVQIRSGDGSNVIGIGQGSDNGGRLEICDDTATARVVAGTSGKLGTLFVTDREQKAAIGFAVNDERVTLNLRDANKATRLALRCDNGADGDAGLFMNEKDGMRGFLGMIGSSDPSLVLYGKLVADTKAAPGRPSVHMGVPGGTAPSIGIKDASGKIRGSLDLESGNVRLRLFDDVGGEIWRAK